MDFVIWRTFKRSTSYRPAHLLCHGFRRSGVHGQNGPQETSHSIPGLSSYYRNTHVETLKGPLWCRLQAILGKEGESLMIDMLTDCGVFTPVKESEGTGNLLQISGIPLSDIEPTTVPNPVPTTPLFSKKPNSLVSENRQPNAITFVRNRMLYARAALNAKGGVRFGMRHIRECPAQATRPA